MEYKLSSLANRINVFDSYYEMSDDYRKIKIGTDEEQALSHWINGLMDSELAHVLGLLNKTGLLNYNRYFKN